MRKLLYCGSRWLLPLLFIAFIFPHQSRSQDLDWRHLKQFGLLAGGSITADHPVSVEGSAGAGNIIDANVHASWAFTEKGQHNVPAALDKLQANRRRCLDSETVLISASLGGQVLRAGVYATEGPATLGRGQTLTLRGEANERFIFNIPQKLFIETQSQLVLDGVSPANVVWNVSGDYEQEDNATFSGVVMANNVTVTGDYTGKLTLLAMQDITLANNTGGRSAYYSREPTVLNWRDAGGFGLLAGTEVKAAATLLVQGAAGAGQTLAAAVQATGARIRNGQDNFPEAVLQLQDNMDLLGGLGGTPVSERLDGQTLTPGTYYIDRNAVIASGRTLELQGDSLSVFIFNLAAGLTLEENALILIGEVRPENIYWNAGGNIVIERFSNAPGIFMSAGPVTRRGAGSGKAALLSLLAVTLHNAYPPGFASAQYFSRQQLQAGPSALRLVCGPAQGPNLVANGSFEDRPTTICSTSFSTIGPLATTACGWFTPLKNPLSIITGSPDHFTGCYNPLYSDVGAPKNNYGYQPARTGSAYAGISAYDTHDPNLHPANWEYLRQQLAAPLKQDRDYYGEFWACAANKNWYYLKDLAMHLGQQPPGFTGGSTVLTAQPQVANTNYLTDTVNWKKVAGAFRAGGGEQYLTIGNFKDRGATVPVYPQQVTGHFNIGYYYIEDVALYEIPYAGPARAIACGAGATLGEGTLLPAHLGAAEYKWFEAGNPVAVFTSTTTFLYPVTPAQTTTYTLQVTIPASPSFGGSVTTSSVTVTVAPVTAGPDFSVCSNAPRQLLNGSPSGGSWSGTGIVNLNGFYYFEPGQVAAGNTYALTYTYSAPAGGCAGSATLQATVLPGVQVTLATTDAGCSGSGSATATVHNGQAGQSYTVCLGNNPCYQVGGQAGSFAIPLSAAQPGNYTLTVTDNRFPACPASFSFAIGSTLPVLGAYGQLTTIDASQPPYSGTVAYSGEYRVAGPLEFINGSFHLAAGTVFYFMPDGGVAPNGLVPQPVPAYTSYPQGGTRNYQPSILKVGAGATLHLDAATLTAACNATEKWGGVHLANGGSIVSQGSTVNGVSTQSLISQACAGVAASQPAANTLPANAYDINGTHFSGNDAGFWETYRPHAGGTVSGIRHSAFTGNTTGIWLVSHNKPAFTPDYGAVALDSNSFVNNVTGFYNGNGYTMAGVTLRGNTFSGNTAFAVRGCGNLLNNTVAVPAGAVGFYASSRLVQGNTVAAAISGNGTGLKIDYCPFPSMVTGNTLSGLVTGVDLTAITEVQLENNTLQDNGRAVLLAPYSLQTVSGNTFTDNQTGILATGTGFGPVPPVISCNTFTAPNVTASKGIHLPMGATMVDVTLPGFTASDNRLGGDESNTYPDPPSGNRFVDVTHPIVNDNPAYSLNYFVYKQISQDITSTTPGLVGVNILTTLLGVSPPPCATQGFSNTGVNARQGNLQVSGTANTESKAGLGLIFPNPAQEQATVAYTLLSGIKAAKLILREVMTGREIKSYDLPLKTEGSRELDLRDLRNGLYTCTLMADGKPVETKILQVLK